MLRAFPTPGFAAPVDRQEFDQSDWHEGATITRVLDPAVKAGGWSLSWSGITRRTLHAIREHRRLHQPGANGQGRVFDFLPPGGTPGVNEIPVYYEGPLSVRSVGNDSFEAQCIVVEALAREGAGPSGGPLGLSGGAGNVELVTGAAITLTQSFPTA